MRFPRLSRFTTSVALLLALPWLLLPVRPAGAQAAPDSLSARRASWLVLPNLFYTPETRVGGGVAAAVVFRTTPGGRPSSVVAAATLTQERQRVLQVLPDLYLAGDRLRVWGELNLSKFPSVFYGVGPETRRTDEESYTARNTGVRLRVVQRVLPALAVGPSVTVWDNAFDGVEPGGLLATRAVTGADGGLNVGAGMTAIYDTRDNLFFPRRGAYVETAVLVHAHRLGSDYRYRHLQADARRFVPLPGRGVLALQVYGEAVDGRAPFPALPLFGGVQLMRGYREGRYRDDVALLAQAEYRFPILGRISGAAFASSGEVAPRLSALTPRHLRVAAGGGLRLRINDEGVNLRADYAVGADGGALYLTLSEAF